MYPCCTPPYLHSLGVWTPIRAVGVALDRLHPSRACVLCVVCAHERNGSRYPRSAQAIPNTMRPSDTVPAESKFASFLEELASTVDELRDAGTGR